jgi:hypothetical protein
MLQEWNAALQDGLHHGGEWTLQPDGSRTYTRWNPCCPDTIEPPLTAPSGVPSGAHHTHQLRNGIARPGGDRFWLKHSGPGRFAPHYVTSHEGVFRMDWQGRIENIGSIEAVLGR